MDGIPDDELSSSATARRLDDCIRLSRDTEGTEKNRYVNKEREAG